MEIILHPPQQFSLEPSKFLAEERKLHLVSPKPFVTNDSYINLVDRCAGTENYCLYIPLHYDFFHSRQLRAASFESSVGKLYQERLFFPWLSLWLDHD